MLLSKVIGALMVLLLVKLLLLKIQNGVLNMNKTNVLFACVAETFYAIGCSGVANAIPA